MQGMVSGRRHSAGQQGSREDGAGRAGQQFKAAEQGPGGQQITRARKQDGTSEESRAGKRGKGARAAGKGG